MQRKRFDGYLGSMTAKYKILQTLAVVLKEAKQPSQYQFIPREIILRCELDWSEIYLNLLELEKEELLQLFTADGLKFSVTQKGLNKAKLLESEMDSEMLIALKKMKIS